MIILDARKVAVLVAMPRLLAELGFEVNTRARRCACIIHGGSNPSAFAWTDSGLWRCHSCGRGGDKIALVREVRQCSYCAAVDFLASLAGVEYSPSRVSLHGSTSARAALSRSAELLADAERIAWREVRDSCHAFDWIREAVTARLEAIHAGGRERFHGEERLAQMALRDADLADAAYTLISFAQLHDRLGYLHGGHEREAFVREALERGGVYTGACGGRHFQEIVR
jgi:hypothetical protein